MSQTELLLKEMANLRQDMANAIKRIEALENENSKNLTQQINTTQLAIAEIYEGAITNG